MKNFKVKSGIDDSQPLLSKAMSATSDTIKLLLEILRKLRVKDAGKREKTTLKEIEELHE